MWGLHGIAHPYIFKIEKYLARRNNHSLDTNNNTSLDNQVTELCKYPNHLVFEGKQTW